MPIMVKFGSFWKSTSVDLLVITAETYGPLLDRRKITEREKAAKNMVKKIGHDDILKAINHLSTICFDLKGAEFIRKGTGSFLADFINVLIEKA